MKEITDTLETMILMALDATHNIVCDEEYQINPMTGFDDMHVNSAYTADLIDHGRMYSANKNDLLSHPAEIIGDEQEVMLIKPGGIVWCGFRRIVKPPRRLLFVGRPEFLYEVHRREINHDGTGKYMKQLLPLSKKGEMIHAFFNGVPLCNNHIACVMYLSASLIEDAERGNAMLAAVKDATEIKFPVPIDDYKDVFSDRDGPMNGARKKAIIHWVAQHMRHSTRGNEHEVKRHTRGVQEFTIDGLRIRLSPNQPVSIRHHKDHK